jgi:hypothetical protein
MRRQESIASAIRRWYERWGNQREVIHGSIIRPGGAMGQSVIAQLSHDAKAVSVLQSVLFREIRAVSPVS